MSRGRDVERYAFEQGVDPSKVSAREARAYAAQIAWNRMMRRLTAQQGAALAVSEPPDFAAELAAGRAKFARPAFGNDAHIIMENTWANEMWRLYKHPPNLYAKFMQAIEKGA